MNAKDKEKKATMICTEQVNCVLSKKECDKIIKKNFITCMKGNKIMDTVINAVRDICKEQEIELLEDEWKGIDDARRGNN